VLLIISGVCFLISLLNYDRQKNLTDRLLFQAVAFLVGFIQKDIYLTLWIGLAGTAFTALVVIPPWPFYNQNPQPWLGSAAAARGGVGRNIPGIIVDGVKVG
jgi:hypothetical protein